MVCQGKPYTTQIILYCLARGIWLIGPWQLTTCLHTCCVIVIKQTQIILGLGFRLLTSIPGLAPLFIYFTLEIWGHQGHIVFNTVCGSREFRLSLFTFYISFVGRG